MNNFKSKALEISWELIIYIVLSLGHYTIFTKRQADFDDVYVVIGLWLAIAVYRLIFLQLPLSWAISFYWAKGSGYREKMLTGLINFSTFILVIYISSFFSPVVAGFLDSDKIFIPGMVLISTTISPILIYLIFFRGKTNA